jgi:transcription elongation GreA/GreB family factor
MNVAQLRQLAEIKNVKGLETAWLEAIEEKLPPAEMAGALEPLVSAGKADDAVALAGMLYEERAKDLSPDEALGAVKALLLAVPVAADLRKEALAAYRKVHGAHPHFAAIVKASGLEASQSPRRALRTMDVCLALADGDYMANKFDHRVLRLVGFQDALGEYELADAAGKVVRLEPKALCDEFEIVGPNDFRVLCQHRTSDLSAMLDSAPAEVLIGLCQTAGGKIDALALKDQLVPKYIAADKWSDWWSKARTAAKRSTQLTLEGRSPVMVVFHPQGRTLEQELAPAVAGAKGPLDRLAILQQYIRETRGRRLTIDAKFAGSLVKSLAEEAVSYRARRPGDALAASLSIDAALAAGVTKPAGQWPSAAEILAESDRPAQLIADLAEGSLWAPAMDALAARPDAGEHLAQLLYKAGPSHLDEIAQRLSKLGRLEAVERAAAAAVADPITNLELAVWLWRGPAEPPANAPSRVELLSKLLGAMQEIDRSPELYSNSTRRNYCQRIRNTLSGADYAGFRAAVAGVDEHMAATIKRQVERSDGLAQAVREDMLNILRENFYGLFAKARVEPWLDEGTIWTTQEALDRRQEEFKELTEVKMLANARAIGAAAEHGDLSENSEWKFALEERDMLRARAAKMQEELAKARVIRHDEVSTEVVTIGTKVHVRRGDGQEMALVFLGPWESDPDHNVYAYQTQLAQAFMGKAPGETVIVRTDGAAEQNYLVERIEPAL